MDYVGLGLHWNDLEVGQQCNHARLIARLRTGFARVV